MEHFVEIIKAVAWPVSIIWLGYIFRSEVRLLLGRISSFKYKDVEASFEKNLAEAENNAKNLEPPKIKSTEQELLQKAQLFRIAEISPRAAVVEAWTLIETAALKKGLSSGTYYSAYQPEDDCGLLR